MKKSNILKILSILLLISVLVSGCGQGQPPPITTVVVTEIVEGAVVERVITATPEPTEEIPEEQVILKLWTVDAGREEYDIAHNNAIAAFEERYPNISIEIVKKPFVGFQDALTAAILANQAPDLADLQSAWAQQYIPLQALVPLTEIVQSIGEDQYGGAEKVAYSADGEWYAVPLFNFPHVLWYRSDLFAEKGLDVPETWIELQDVASQLTEDTDGDGEIDRYGLIMAMSTTDQDFALQFGTATNNATFLDADGNPILQSGTEEYDRFVESLAYLKSLKTCCMSDGVLTWSQTDTRNMFLNDEAAMLVSSVSFVYNIQRDNPDLMSKVGTAPWPYNSENPDASSKNYWGGYGTTILKTSDNQEEARLFIEFLHEYDVELKWFQDTITGWLPSRKDIVESDAYWQSERLAPVESIIREGGSYAATHGEILGMEEGSNEWAPIFFSRRLYAQLWTQLIAEDLSPDQAAQWMQTELETIIASEQ